MLERQSKLDGLRRWKFEAILQTFPLLLQLALLLFATALSVYLWTVHLSVAIVVLALTSLGFVSYLFLLGSAVLSPNSPFQTPLTDLFAKFVSRIMKPTFLAIRNSTRPLRQQVSWHLWHLRYPFWKLENLIKRSWSPCSHWRVSKTPILPRFASGTRSDPKMMDPPPDYYFSGPSNPARAILWVLQTSADPTLIDCAVEMGIDPDIQWPAEDNIVTPMLTLHYHFISCFDWAWESGRNGQSGYRLQNIRPGMSRRAIQCGKLYCSLRNIARASGTQWTSLTLMPSSSILAEAGDQATLDQLLTVIQLATDSPNWELDWSTPNAIRWALHIIPSLYIGPPNSENTSRHLEYFLDQFPEEHHRALDAATFTNYLCCLCSILGHVNQQVMGQVDKM